MANSYALTSPRIDVGITSHDSTKIFIQEFARTRGATADVIGADLLQQLQFRMSGSAGGSNRSLPTEIRDAIMEANGAKLVRYAGSLVWGAVRDVGSATYGAPRTAASAVKATGTASAIGILGCLSGGSKLLLTTFWERFMQLDRNPYYFVSDDPQVVSSYLDFLTYTYLDVGRVQPQHTG